MKVRPAIREVQKNQRRRPRAVLLGVETKAVAETPAARIERRVVRGEDTPQASAELDAAGHGRALGKQRREELVRTRNARASRIVQIEIGDQMQSWIELGDGHRRGMVGGDPGGATVRDQEIEW